MSPSTICSSTIYIHSPSSIRTGTSMSSTAASTIAERLALAAGVGLVLPNRVLLQLRLRKRLDGWRRAAGLVLRGEAATFVLSAFSLDLWSDTAPRPESATLPVAQQHVAARLSKLLCDEADAHIHVRRGSRA